MANVIVTGGCGYTGSVLVPKLLSAGHRVTVWDIQWFGNHLEPHPNLKVIRSDIRNEMDCSWADSVIHLAAIANDPSGELDAKLTWETNALATMRLADACFRSGVKRFIYASSGSVYGIKGDLEVTEDEPCVPVTEYNKAKMVSERALLSYAGQMDIAIIRPGTVCGWSPRQRLDISVNGLTMKALDKKEIKVSGSHLMRANVHIEDLTDLYVWLLDNRVSGIYNAAFQNASLGEIAKSVQTLIGGSVVEAPITDSRSYKINSQKLLNVGFSPKRTIETAIRDLMEKHKEGKLKDVDDCYNLKVTQR